MKINEDGYIVHDDGDLVSEEIACSLEDAEIDAVQNAEEEAAEELGRRILASLPEVENDLFIGVRDGHNCFNARVGRCVGA